MSRSTELEQTARETGWSKPARVSGLDQKQPQVRMSKEQSNAPLTLKNTLRKRYERDRYYYGLSSIPFCGSDLMGVFGVTI